MSIDSRPASTNYPVPFDWENQIKDSQEHGSNYSRAFLLANFAKWIATTPFLYAYVDVCKARDLLCIAGDVEYEEKCIDDIERRVRKRQEAGKL